ncbi:MULTISPECIES: hypothetical protein [Nocardiaceae]|uniref:hypothetical protein n=1 Tax=Nocardiaceae TaxID=85025 RepID=UPI00070A5914|nr:MULTISPECIES: hypothetical protein [Rhodococcus]KQU31468.1 hypothetical protein ASH04_13440 [Rhodococcus sp. Leaf233]
MSANESEALLMDFALKWEPYGGAPDSEIFIEFGLGAGDFKRRLFVLLSKPDHVAPIDPERRGRLVDYCLRATERTPRSGEQAGKDERVPMRSDRPAGPFA